MHRLFLSVTLGLTIFTSGNFTLAAVVISEFMAENDGGLADQDGDTPDWIELFNNSPGTVNLAGWHLTDTPTNLTKWTFPATSVAPGGFLIVFASGKNRAVPGAELHANFQLESRAGFLALVQPDGATIATAYTNYPAQHRNVSFGTGLSNSPPVTLLGTNANARWLVPTNDALSATWTAPGFDASTWNATNTPLRYDVTLDGGALRIDFNARSSNTDATTQVGFNSFIIGGAGVQSTNITRTYGGFSVTISPSAAGITYDDRARTSPSNGGALTTQNIYRDFVFSAYNAANSGTNGLDFLVAGLAAGQSYQLTVWSFDSGSGGSRVSDWYANGSLVTNNYTFNGSTLPIADTANRFSFSATVNPSGQILIAGRRDTSTAVNNASVFINALQLVPTIAVPATNGNVVALAGQNSGLYARQSFVVADPSAFNQLTLHVRYDDGFIAYLNGTEVARRHAPASPTWNSAATTTNSAAAAEDVLLPGATSLLVTGTNVLAVQALNSSAGDDDFFLEPQLVAAFVSVTAGRYLAVPTPGALNNSGFLGVVADTKFNAERGFYDAPFSLSITTATAGATIYYTTNGSAPAPGNGFVHTAPISITGNSFIRAGAYLAGWVPSGIDTHSYIFLTDVLRQSNNIPGYPTVWQAGYNADYAMDPALATNAVYGATLSNDLRSIATLALVADQDGLWNSSTGIYPNPTSIGPAWERAASLELIRGDGHTEFATTAKIQVHGNASRDNVRTPKHSIGVSFNSDYGPTKLNYDWFGGGVTKQDGVVLRSCGFVDGWAGRYADASTYTSTNTGESFRGLRYRPENTCYLRDSWMKDSFVAMGWLSSRSAYVHLYINGLYWGLYEPSEHYKAGWFSQRLGGDEGAWDVVVGEDNNGPPVLVDGSLTDWNAVLALANAGVSSEAAYAAITNVVEIDNLIDYMLLHIFGESEDWPRHNWFASHRRATNGVPATRFIFSVWDQELTLDRLVHRNRINVGNGADGAGELYSPARVYAQLRNWPEFRLRFADRVQKHFFNGGALTPSNNVVRLLASASVISSAVNGESARWGDARKTANPAGQTPTGQTFTRNEYWQPEIDKLATNFLPGLTAFHLSRLQAGNLYPFVGAPTFNQFGGAVPAGFTLTMAHTNVSGTIYFTTDQSDPRVYGSGVVAAGAQAFASPVAVNAPTVVRARVFDGANWSALVETVFYPPQDLSRLAVTEIMYRPPVLAPYASGELEFVELKNYGTNTLDLTGCGFTSGISFNFTNGTLLAPGQFFVLVRSAAAFAAKYPGVTVHGIFSGQLANNGEKLTLSQQAIGGPPFGPAIFSVSYGTTAPWPVTPDGFGFSVVPVQPGVSQAPDDGAKWRASTASGGSPGADDPAPVIASIVINEVLTHTDLPAVDRIEVHNPTLATVDIGGWFLSDDPAVPKKFRIVDNAMISAGGFLSFDETQFNPTPGTNGSFSLGSSGEQVYLFSGDANTNLTGWSHGFNFGAAAKGVTFGRYLNSVGEEQFPAQLANSFNATNSGPRVGPLVINEIHYHPVLPADAFVELKNITAASVLLFDPANPDNTWHLDGLGFVFPRGVTLPPGGLVLVVISNIAGFTANHAVPTNVPVFTYEYLGTLQQDGERLSLTRPDAPDTNGTPYIVVDSVRYNDKAPWPAAADGSGPSLQRKFSNQYGDDPINWQAAAPTPGRENPEADSDADGMPDSWELLNGTLLNTPDANDDADGDGYTNFQEYLAGTHPNDPQSRLHVESVRVTGGGVEFQFTAASNRSFRVQFKDSLDALLWSPLTNITAAPQTRAITITAPPTNSARFFRLAVP